MGIDDKFITIMKNKQIKDIVVLAKYICFYVVNQIQPCLNMQVNVGRKRVQVAKGMGGVLEQGWELTKGWCVCGGRGGSKQLNYYFINIFTMLFL